MVFITASSKSWRDRCRLLLAVALLWGGLALAAEIEVAEPRLAATEDGYALSADFAFEFNQRLEEAVSKGVVLYFVAEFELTRPRWYWFDEKVVSRSQTYRLSYHALTRQYRLSVGALHQSFSTLQDALQFLGRVAALPVADKSAIKAGETYAAALRLALDKSQLPKPFQVDAIANRDWQVDAKVLRWNFTPTGDGR